jgi:organic hydroperoxide reductase OsmC/OhrA
MTKHTFATTIRWTGNNGPGTTRYDAYERSHVLSIQGKPDLLCSSDTAFRGNGGMHNPEDLLVASLSSCHMLWYLHLCADAGIVVTGYTDNATGIMETDAQGEGRFSAVILNPVVTVAEASMTNKAIELHTLAHRKCFIANSCNFPVTHNPVCNVQEPAS